MQIETTVGVALDKLNNTRGSSLYDQALYSTEAAYFKRELEAAEFYFGAEAKVYIDCSDLRKAYTATWPLR